MAEEMELVINMDEVEDVDKYRGLRYTFPVVTIGNNVVYYNDAAVNAIGTDMEYVRYGFTSQYIVVTPSDFKKGKTFKLSPHRSRGTGKSTALPAQLRDKKVADGTYRLVPVKGGMFAFDRYAPIARP